MELIDLKKEVQHKYHKTEKGYLKMQRNNERRRNKTKFKKVMAEFRKYFSSE